MAQLLKQIKAHAMPLFLGTYWGGHVVSACLKYYEVKLSDYVALSTAVLGTLFLLYGVGSTIQTIVMRHQVQNRGHAVRRLIFSWATALVLSIVGLGVGHFVNVYAGRVPADAIITAAIVCGLMYYFGALPVTVIELVVFGAWLNMSKMTASFIVDEYLFSAGLHSIILSSWTFFVFLLYGLY